jgi:cytochrome c553
MDRTLDGSVDSKEDLLNIFGRSIMTNWLRASSWLALAFLPGIAQADDAAGEAFFESKVRPLLVARCLECHGETGKAKGGLRLTSRESLLRGGETGPAAIPGKADASLIVGAVRYVDEPKMPPKGKLPDEEIAILERWVSMGLPWPKAAADTSMKGAEFRITDEQRRFWSFRPVQKFEPPEVRQGDWPLNPIDRFILARLEKEGLKPSPPADRRTLIRRVTFDLTGLPPTPEDVSTFLNDQAADAFEKVVDRLLASPSYGQRWGRHWLDVARYADSRDARGVGGDGDIGEAFRYRDWVVDALNKDLPYDQFIVQQVAGDLLPGPTPDDIDPDAMVATGLLTIGEWGIGDADKEKMLTDIVADQIDVVTRGFLGLTVACARCHDHKFDPIATADYYALAGIFFSTKILPDPGPKTAGSPMLRTPIATKARREEIATHQRKLSEAQGLLAKAQNTARNAVARAYLPRLREALRAASERDLPASATTDLPPFVVRKWAKMLGGDPGRRLLRAMADVQGRKGVHFWSGEADPPWIGVNSSGEPVSFSSLTLPPRSVNLHPGPQTPAAIRWRSPIAGLVNVEAKIADADPNGGNGVTTALTLRKAGSTRELASATVDNGGRKTLEGGALNGVEVKVGDVIELVVTPRGEYSFDTTTVGFTIKSQGDEPASWDLTADLLPDLLKANPHADRQGHEAVWELVQIDPSRSSRPIPGHPAWADWDQNQAIDAFANRAEADPKFLDALVGPSGPFSPDLADEASTLPESARAEIARNQAEVDRLQTLKPPPIPLALVAQEGGVPRSVYEGFHDARIQVRGDYRRLGAEVPRHVPEIVAGDSAPKIAKGSGRLELARWIASASNPLTSRVMVNRVWQGHFGSGLVRTSSNFGKLGESPSHPELLDWLASRFVSDGWSLKKLHKLMVTSQTYQQSSIDTNATKKVDPDNRLLGRMERNRLESEAVRDSLLAVAGKLDPSLGGPSTRDFNAPRRTLYQMTIRSDRSSFGPLFDAADSTAMVDRRVVSTVAPQALFLMNHPFVIEQAKALGQRLQKEAENDKNRIERAYDLLYARKPTAEEVEIGQGFLAEMTKAENSSERAWTAYAQVLLCANEFLYVD